MKRSFIIILFTLMAMQLFSFIGFGASVGTDFVEIEEVEENFSFDLEGLGSVDYFVSRDAVSNPVHLGIQGYLDLPAIPIGLELGLSTAFQEYSWTAPSYLTASNTIVPLDLGIETENGMYKEDFAYLRLSTDATAKYYLPLKLPMFKFYVGGGAGLHFITPMISKEIFIENLQKQTYSSTNPEAEIDIEELVLANTNFGGHIVGGMRFKPWMIPLSINIDYKHTFTPENDYGDPTNTFGNIRASLNLYF